MRLNPSQLLRWEDPPPVNLGHDTPRRPWATVAAKLRERPGKWALIDDASTVSLAPRINKGVSWWKPQGTYEAVTANVDGRIHTWARYLAGWEPRA